MLNNKKIPKKPKDKNIAVEAQPVCTFFKNINVDKA
jgi:hypothetical protein